VPTWAGILKAIWHANLEAEWQAYMEIRYKGKKGDTSNFAKDLEAAVCATLNVVHNIILNASL
jgi:hypothetical protein